MNRLNYYLLTLLLAETCYVNSKELTEIEGLSVKPKHCSYERAYEMYGVNCAGLGLNKLPSLRGGIEILDFSRNRLRNIHSDTFSSYSSIKFLYLSENYIRHIADDAFDYLTDLKTLDLSMNAITQLPDSIFQITSLRKLYLSGNSLTYLDSKIQPITKPIKAPLELLDISDCEIRELPKLGFLPDLVVLNISHNPLLRIDQVTFALACNLAKVDMTNAIDHVKLCDLRPIMTWFQEKNIYLELTDYSRLNSKEFDQCPIEEIDGNLNATHHRCKSQYLKIQTMKSSRRSMMTILGGLAGFLIGFILLLYLTHRWNVSRIKNAEKKMIPQQGTDKQASAVLLSNIS